MDVREVPRHIDAPNRMPEYVVSALGGYYGTMFITGSNFLISMLVAIICVYIIYRLTLGKPEGYATRFMYRFISFGKGIPSPVTVRRFEV